MAVWCVWLVVFVVCIGLDGADFDLVCWRRSDCVCPVDRGSESLHSDGSVCRCFIPSFVFNKTIGTPVYQSEDGADQCGRAGG